MKKLALLLGLTAASAFSQATVQVIQNGGDACRALQALTKAPCIDSATVFVFSNNPRTEGFKVDLRYALFGANGPIVETRIIPAYQIPGSPGYVGVIMLDRARNVGAEAKTLVTE
jgi:hypothetical protein